MSVTTAGSVPWLAVQDGSGAWQALSGSSFMVTNAAGKYGVAWECTQGTGVPAVEIVLATIADATTISASCDVAAPATNTVSGSVSGVPTNGDAWIGVGDRVTSVLASTSTPTYSVANVAAGWQQVIAYGESGSTNGLALTKMVRGSVDIGGSTTVDIYLASSAAVTITNKGVVALASSVPSGEEAFVGAGLRSSTLAFGRLMYMDSSAYDYPVVPSSLAQPGDTYCLVAGAKTLGGAATQETVLVSQSPPATADLQAPAPLTAAAGVAGTGGTATVSWGTVRFTTPAGATEFAGDVNPGPASGAEWAVSATPAWLGSSTTYTFPDFSGTTGWSSGWDFPSGESATATTLAVHANVSFQQMLAFDQTQDYTVLPNGTNIALTRKTAVGIY